MGKSVDFSEGIKLIQAAHSDAAAILEKWRDLIESPGEVTLSLKMEDGTVQEVTLPTIREAINRYLGGVFEQITLVSAAGTVTIRLNDDGYVEMVLPDGTYANIATGNLVARQISGANGVLPITGDVILQKGTVQNATIQSIKAVAGTVKNATFSGEVTISGSSTISGRLSIKSLKADALVVAGLTYGKPVIKFDVEGISDTSLDVTNGDVFVGDVSILEAAGVRSVPTWADCMYSPNGQHVGSNTIHVYWGDPDVGDVMLINRDGSYDFSPEAAVAWPYKMYEKVTDGYRIRWLPLEDVAGRLHFARCGDAGHRVPTCIEEAATATGITVRITRSVSASAYTCPRFMAGFDTSISDGVALSVNTLYRM